AIAFTYDSLNFSNNYSVAKDPDSYPPTLTASPSLREATMDPSKWRYWVATDCQDALAAVFRVEVTEGQRPGRIVIYNKAGHWTVAVFSKGATQGL
ncbi:PEP4, partial [Symbiodinium sp. CCMP2456]